MNRDDIIRMAKEAGAIPSGDPQEWDVWLFQDPAMERFAALVEAEKNEEITELKHERRRDMAEICSLRESEESLREEVERLRDELRQSSIDHTRAEVERLREDNEQFAALVGQYAAEQAPDALRMVVKDRDALQAENERLREALKRHGMHNADCFLRGECNCGLDAALHGETAIWSARHDPRE